MASLLGANRRYIDAHLPHIGQLLTPQIEQVIEQSEVLVVGIAGGAVVEALVRHCRADHTVLDLVNLGPQPGIAALVEGLCWTA